MRQEIILRKAGVTSSENGHHLGTEMFSMNSEEATRGKKESRE